ncbi:hypothetical protein SLS62_000948 [Diatrype stigma]|uniref:Uncharacterized protein n=1 Tax=Diatrype stigma TaxID=117547 RepID=A0AAN9YW81_9PEZI
MAAPHVNANKAICCAACGIPVLPSVANPLLDLFTRQQMDWQKPMLLRPGDGFHEAMKDPRYSHAYKRCDDDLMKVDQAFFSGAGDGFRVRVWIEVEGPEDEETGAATVTKSLVIRKAIVFTKDKRKTGAADFLPVPLHEGCLAVLRRFCTYQSRFRIDFRAPRGGAPSSIAHFWEIWQQRIFMTPNPIPAPKLPLPPAFLLLPVHLAVGQIQAHFQGSLLQGPAIAQAHIQSQLQVQGPPQPQAQPPPAGGGGGGTGPGNGNGNGNGTGNAQQDDDHLVPLDRPIFEPHRYLGAPYIKKLDEYRDMLRNDTVHGHIVSRWEGFKRFQADPRCPRRPGVLTVTAQIMLRLRPIYGNLTNDSAYPDAGIAQVLARVGQLPAELQELVEDQMEPFVDESLLCTRAFPPLWWREKLFEGNIIPWLWDLNFEEVRRQRIASGVADPDDETGWDWEMLVRKLSQSSVFEENGILHDDRISLGLWNRHRIWTLLDRARLGHLAPIPPSFSANLPARDSLEW